MAAAGICLPTAGRGHGCREREPGHLCGEPSERLAAIVESSADAIAEVTLAPILDRQRRGLRIDHYPARQVRKDGAVIDMSITASPVRNADGVVVAAATVARDVTGASRLLLVAVISLKVVYI